MAEITQAEAERTKRIAATIEQCRLRLQNVAKDLAILAKSGRATCAELRAYNLWALSIYQTNKGMLTVARANGATTLPLLPPTPMLFSYRGYTGNQAGDFPCDAASSTLHGALNAALKAADSGVYLPADSVMISPPGAEIDASQAPTLPQIEQQLGAVWIPAIIIIGIAVSAAAVVVAITSWLKQQEVTERTVTVSNNNLKVFETASRMRAQCMTDCGGTGASATACAKACDTAFPVPQAALPGSGGGAGGSGLGFWTWTLLGAAGIVGGSFAYRRWKKNRREAED